MKTSTNYFVSFQLIPRGDAGIIKIPISNIKYYQELRNKEGFGGGFWYEVHLLSGEIIEAELIVAKDEE